MGSGTCDCDSCMRRTPEEIEQREKDEKRREQEERKWRILHPGNQDW